MGSEDPHMQMVRLTIDMSILLKASHLLAQRGTRRQVGSMHRPHSERVKTRGLRVHSG